MGQPLYGLKQNFETNYKIIQVNHILKHLYSALIVMEQNIKIDKKEKKLERRISVYQQ